MVVIRKLTVELFEFACVRWVMMRVLCSLFLPWKVCNEHVRLVLAYSRM